MNAVSVIVMSVDAQIESINTFISPDSEHLSKLSEAAEQEFLSAIETQDFTEEEKQNVLEEGYFETNDGRSVFLYHSDSTVEV